VAGVQSSGANMQEQASEKAAFLESKNPAGFSRTRSQDKLEQNSRRCLGWSKTRLCCCGCLVLLVLATAAVTVVCLMFFVFQVGDKSMTRGEADMIEATLRGQGHSRASAETNFMSGSYKLMAYDENYRPYLEAMGVPWFVIPIILASKDRVTYMDLGDSVTVVTETTVATRHTNITFGEEFSTELPKGMGTIWSLCTRQAINVILCESEDRERGKEMTAQWTFTENGAINERVFTKENIVTKKFYKREGSPEEITFDEEETKGSGDSWDDSLEFEDEDW